MRVLLTALLAFGAGAALTFLLNDGDPTRATDTSRAADSRTTSRASVVEDLARVEKRLETAEAENVALRERVDVLAKRLETATRGAAQPGEKESPGKKGPALVYPLTAKALRVMDWDEMGGAVATLMPLLSEAVDVVQGTREMRAELWGEITGSLGPIITQAVRLEQAGISQDTWNHPSVLVNFVHATLKKAGQPLSKEQEEELYRIGLLFIEEDARRLAAYTESTVQLRKMLDQSLLHGRLYEAVEPMLTAAQETVLYPPGVRGLVAVDVFSGASMWDEHFQRIQHTDRASLRQRGLEKLQQGMQLRDSLQPTVKALVGQWEAGFPDAYVFEKPDAIRRSDMEKLDRLLEAAERQAALYEALLREAPLTKEERARVIEHDQVFVPILAGG